MRPYLETYLGEKIRVSGTFSGKRQIYGNPPVLYLFIDIKNADGVYITGHAWIKPCKKMRRMKMKSGRRYQFDATVKNYTKIDPGQKYKNKCQPIRICDVGFFDMANPSEGSK